MIRAAIVAVVLAAAVGGIGVAAAQSKRYPPLPVDKDAEAATKSKLWNAAITPERQPYQDLVRGAQEQLALRTKPVPPEVIRLLDEAVALLPREPDAYRLRGDAHFDNAAWERCAADFAAAERYARRDEETPRAMVELRRRLGLCQARAGKLADAEATLADAVAAGNAAGELWMRLGEVRVAMGKLDEAIAALKSALDSTEGSAQALINFMLATAYDRARRPGDALAAASDGVRQDPHLASLKIPVMPPVSPGEHDYMLALAYSSDTARPEHALALFRRFVKASPTSPWRKRAEEHIRDIKTAELPETFTRTGAPFDIEAARTAVRRSMPQLRACLAGFSTSVVEVEISRAGPRTPPTDRTRPKFSTPPDGVTVRRAVGELTDRELIEIDRCLQPIASKLAMPVIKERDTFYKAAFHVVGP